MPKMYMIGGPNGSGKTTSAMDLLPKLLNCYEYVNADAIAAALSPFSPESTAIQAGRLMLERIHHLAEHDEDFAFETTMASRSFAPFLKKNKVRGYQINLLFLWLRSPELAIKRVHERVLNGGHNIPDEIINRRYVRSIANFIKIYIPLADSWSIYDNSYDNPIMIAEKKLQNTAKIFDKDLWKLLMGVSHEGK